MERARELVLPQALLLPERQVPVRKVLRLGLRRRAPGLRRRLPVMVPDLLPEQRRGLVQGPQGPLQGQEPRQRPVPVLGRQQRVLQLRGPQPGPPGRS